MRLLRNLSERLIERAESDRAHVVEAICERDDTPSDELFTGGRVVLL